MRLTRIHVPGPLSADGVVELPPAAARHVARVLRLQAGDALALFDGLGTEHEARIERASTRAVQVRVGARIPGVAEPRLQIELAQGVSRGERMDLVVQKCVELGVTAIQPLATARSVVRLDARRAQARVAHWRGVAIAACEQCGRSMVPQVRPVMSLDDWLARRDPAHYGLVLDPTAGQPMPGLAPPPGSLSIVVGPEGGLEDRELKIAGRAGLVPVRLGPRVLRTETAAIACIAVAQALWGDAGR
jgi:16S rRNA (uracil1498-N3)-methyltransferase